MGILSGRQMRAVCEGFCPFEDSGGLKPEKDRVTILAANAFQPLDVMCRAYVMAASGGEGSPILVQLSFSALKTAGGGNMAAGALLAKGMMEDLVSQYPAGYVGMTLDHFRVPGFPAPREESSEGQGPGLRLGLRLAKARIEDAVEAARGVPGCAVTGEAVDEYVHYMTSPQYASFRRSFMAVVQAASPAWGMIDTEKLPPALDFAVTRDIVDLIRRDLGNREIILEAEFGATGCSGDEITYVRLEGERLGEFARAVAAFIEYTGADAIAYPIGMEHAAKLGETHEPDVTRLIAVHREVMRTTGRYVPFAQHGGTGAARLALGLVGKNNVATRFLVAGANHIADHVQRNVVGIRAGVKSACGPAIFEGMVEALVEAAVGKLKECNSYGRGPEIARMLGREAQPARPCCDGFEAPANVE
ncbi:MAG: class II fructose-bisphosphate aldolase [Bacillota bacterium]